MKQQLYQITNYMRFWLKSGNAHGLHSPYLYQLYDEVVGEAKHFYAFAELEQLRQQLLDDRSVLNVSDFGAGTSGKREVRNLAATSLSPKFKAQFLFRLVHHLRPQQLLELGTSLGLSTQYLLSAAPPTAQLISIEGSESLHKYAKSLAEKLRPLSAAKLQLEQGNIDEVLPQLLTQKSTRYNFVFMDANHRYEPTLNYFELLLPHLAEGAVVVLDDIYWSEEMTKAWNELRERTEISLSVDFYHFGMLVLLPGVVKQHFYLRM